MFEQEFAVSGEVAAAFEDLGIEVEVATADVVNIEGTREVLAAAQRRLGALPGVSHTAANIGDGVIQTRNPVAVDQVFTVKGRGSFLLAEAKLVTFVLVSSISSLPGQASFESRNI